MSDNVQKPPRVPEPTFSLLTFEKEQIIRNEILLERTKKFRIFKRLSLKRNIHRNKKYIENSLAEAKLTAEIRERMKLE